MLKIDLRAPEGNAYALIAQVKRWGKDLEQDTTSTIQEMTSGNYAKLLTVMEREFGEYFEFVNKP